jgi:hypothetical protein
MTGKDRLTAPFENAGFWMGAGYRKVSEISREKLTPPHFGPLRCFDPVRTQEGLRGNVISAYLTQFSACRPHFIKRRVLFDNGGPFFRKGPFKKQLYHVEQITAFRLLMACCHTAIIRIHFNSDTVSPVP